MAVIRGMMPAFELFQPASVADALSLLDRHAGAWVLGGGLDTFDALYDRIHQPSVVVDLGGIPELRGIRESPDGLEIGAMTTLTEVSEHPAVRERFAVLAESAALVGSPQIRHQGTIGGNVSQNARCWYFRGGWSCLRAGGDSCYAGSDGMNREHAIFEPGGCVAVNPSDTAPALVALDATMVIRSSAGERVVDAEHYFAGPAADVRRMTVLKPGEVLTAVRIPSAWSGARFYFEKVRERRAWDFALANIASALKVSNGTIGDARLVVNAVAGRPLRLHAVEEAVKGRAVSDELVRAAGELAIRGAEPLRDNGYKVPLVRNLVRRALRTAAATA